MIVNSSSDHHIQESNDGSHTVFSDHFGAHYHSIYGAIEEAIHVFISAGLYFLQRKGQTSFHIFEMGFGTGLNAYLSLVEAHKNKLEINYVCLESHPLPPDIYDSLNYPAILDPASALDFAKLHSSPWNSPQSITSHFIINKIQIGIEEFQFDQSYDLVYYDAFAPSCQEHLWEEDIHKKIYNHLKPGGVFVTYCTKGSFKRMLKSLGYNIQILNGPSKKREMVRAIKPAKY